MIKSQICLPAFDGIARTGNQAFGNYLQYSQYLLGDAQTQVQFGNEFIPTIRPSAVDPNIQWEKTHAYNVGLDFGLMNQRLTGSIDAYVKTTHDLIFTVPVAAGETRFYRVLELP